MSRVDSRYKRKPRDEYSTPEWVTEALVPHLPWRCKIWEPACGEGNIVRVLTNSGFDVYASDIKDEDDFFCNLENHGCHGIITNPPYRHVDAFIEYALQMMLPCGGFVAMLLSADFDSAKSRRHLFGNCSIFAKTIVLTQRIVWFERNDGKRAAPSENHRWFVWDYRHDGPPITRYAP